MVRSILLQTTIRRWILFSVAVTIFFLVVVIKQPRILFTEDSFFEPPMSDTEAAVLLRTLVALVNALDRINATYFMTSGTLLGSYRHHGFIPWDDDIDIITSTADKARVYDALLSLAPDYALYLHARLVDPMHWKLFSTTGTYKVPLRPYRWPFLDVLFYDEDEHFVWNESPWFADERWPRSAVFPLVKRPFNGMWLPAPCDTAAVLAVNFDIDQCASPSYSHVYDVRLMTSIAVPCNSLRLRFPFVNRSKSSSTNISVSGRSGDRIQADSTRSGDEIELLTIGSRTLEKLTVPARCGLTNGR